MKKNTVIILSVTMCLLAAAAPNANARTSYANSFIDTYPDACQELLDAADGGGNASSCVLCHVGGSSRNSYGNDYRNNSHNFGNIENMDSDGDGRTNIEEILSDCTNPGDMVSPVATNSWSMIKALYR